MQSLKFRAFHGSIACRRQGIACKIDVDHVAGPGRTTSQRTSHVSATRPHWCGGCRRVRRTQEGLAAVPVGGGGAWPGFEPTHRTMHQHRRRRRCGGRRRVRRAQEGLAAVPVGGGGAWPGFETAHHHAAPQAPLVWRVPEGPEGTGGLRDRPLRAAGSRVAISRAAGPDGAQNTSGAASNKLNREFRLCRRRGRLAGGPPPTGTHSGQTQQDRPRGARKTPWCHKPRPKVRTPRSTPGSGRPGGRRGDRAR